jgi:hypothetical protein
MVMAVPRPSPVNPAIRLVPEPCAMGRKCYGVDVFQQQLRRDDANAPVDAIPLVSMRSEADMREWYRTGTMPPSSKKHSCVVCHLYITYKVITSLGNLPHGSANAAPLCCQFIASDSTAEGGYLEEAILRPSDGNPVQPMPMPFLRQDTASIRTWRYDPPLSARPRQHTAPSVTLATMSSWDAVDDDDDGDGTVVGAPPPRPTGPWLVPYIDISRMTRHGVRFSNSAVWSSDDTGPKNGVRTPVESRSN